MSDTVIKVENLSKRYRLGELHSQTGSFREKVAQAISRIANNAKRISKNPTPPAHDAVRHAPCPMPQNAMSQAPCSMQSSQDDHLWALRNVSFKVNRGEIVGIIGRNGAGKSTILKILSRITKPTKGHAWINGRVGSLIEVGTGFHPELTGRENIYLNGAILGMSKAEIRLKFDEIVEFAEVDKFIDTPIKRYSSGMYVRLAFAVAAHLEPDILLVDEVLAVGDVEFQKKCIGKMGDIANVGRTVLFVSHNMAAIRSLCERAILFGAGVIECDSTVLQTVNVYLQSFEKCETHSLADLSERTGQGKVRLTDLVVVSNCKLRRGTLATGLPACFIFTFSKFMAKLHFTFTIYDQFGQGLAVFSSSPLSPNDSYIKNNKPEIICEINELPLIGGRYRINTAVYNNGQLQDHVEGAAFFVVENDAFQGRRTNGSLHYGSVCIPHRWFFPSQ